MASFRVLVLHGPNLDLLGTREPDIYGSETYSELKDRIVGWGEQLGINVCCAQSNSEGQLIDSLHASVDTYDSVIINPGAFTHTSMALRDAIAAINLPVYEVHLTNIYSREVWRNHSVISSVCRGVLSGLGAFGYLAALQAASGESLKCGNGLTDAAPVVQKPAEAQRKAEAKAPVEEQDPGEQSASETVEPESVSVASCSEAGSLADKSASPTHLVLEVHKSSSKGHTELASKASPEASQSTAAGLTLGIERTNQAGKPKPSSSGGEASANLVLQISHHQHADSGEQAACPSAATVESVRSETVQQVSSEAPAAQTIMSTTDAEERPSHAEANSSEVQQATEHDANKSNGSCFSVGEKSDGDSKTAAAEPAISEEEVFTPKLPPRPPANKPRWGKLGRLLGRS